MRLKTIEIKGFKSFADSTNLHFGEDITGIVGPNGSGKSNIVDAIRWVLGEMKSKELRLEKMHDVIFNGTKKRKGGTMAQVSLTFENTKNLLPTEYQMVKVSRLLFNTGDSEYRLNDVTCRRKDIMNLFIDTGIGSNSYAIIAQGMIADVIDDRDQSRRRMFEQAAGVSKYKARKKETINKLNATNDDLDRVDDLLYEIERSLKDLERQAKRAKKYKELKANYRDKGIKLGVLNSNKYKEEYATLKDRIIKEKQNLVQLKSESHKVESALEEQKANNLEKQQKVSSSQKELNEMLDELRRLESAREIKKQRLELIKAEINRLSLEISESGSKRETLQISIEELVSQAANANSQREVAKEAMDSAKNHYESLKSKHELAKADLSNIMTMKHSIDASVFDLEKNKAINENRIGNNKRNVEHSAEALGKNRKSAEELKKESEILKKSRDTIAQNINKLRSKEEIRKEKVAEISAKLQGTKEQKVIVQRDLDKKQNEYRLLKSMVDNLEGFPDSVKFLSKNWSKDQPLLSDIVDCKKDYRLAIESFLEPYLNHFVVDDMTEAMSAMNLLSSAQKGKAQFFLLDKFAPKDNKGVSDKIKGSLVAAGSVIKVGPKYKNLFDNLLYGVFVTEDRAVIDSLDEKITLIHTRGDIIRQYNQVKGGSVGLFEGKKIGRKAELEKLDKLVKSLDKSVGKLEVQIVKLETKLGDYLLDEGQDALQNYERELVSIDQRYIGCSTRLEGVQSSLKEAELREKSLLEEIDVLTIENKSIGQRLSSHKREIEMLDQKISDQGGNMDEWLGHLSLASEDLSVKSREFLNIDNLAKGVEQRIEMLQDQMTGLKKTVSEGGQRISDDQKEQEILTADIEKIEMTLSTDYASKGDYQNKLNEVEKQYYAEQNIIREREELARSLNRKINDQQELVDRISQKYSDARINLHSITDRMEVEFGITLEEILKQDLEIEISREELEIAVNTLKSKIEYYGEINPMALEAFDEMKVRYDSIVQQKQDILDARASLEETIQEIESKATAQYLEAFNKVKENFEVVFRRLFTPEDKCDIILSDPENPLDSQIEIVAQPKGKRPRSLSQLSGGEKALTSIALLFSLYLLKPAPFCILDEVDAPLDDLNVVKFNEIIREFSEQSQFIVITHNKLSMASVDVLYGIYMEEQGISNVSQVDFRHHEHELILEQS